MAWKYENWQIMERVKGEIVQQIFKHLNQSNKKDKWNIDLTSSPLKKFPS